MIQLDYRSGVPICDQIVNGIIRLKMLGVLKDHQQLPGVRTLAMQLSVNPNTVQKAYSVLELQGIVYTVKGKGSFLSGDERASAAIFEKTVRNFKEAIGKAADNGLTRKDLEKALADYYEEGEKDL